MKKTRKSMALWAVVVTVWSLSALHIGRLHAENITWHPGFMPKAGAPKTETVAVGMHAITNKGFALRNYVLIGWSTWRRPVVKTYAAENKIRPFYKIGDSLRITQDTTLYAVWAIDANNNGYADYYDVGNNLQISEAFLEEIRKQLKREREEAEAERSRPAAVSLRSFSGWNINHDILAYESMAYFAGCWYNRDTTLDITEYDVSIRGLHVWNMIKLKARVPLELVFEYGGVLQDSCLVGGKAQKPITRIPFPADGTTTVKDLFSKDPIMFTRIKEDGKAILKFYFVRQGTDSLANKKEDWDFSGIAGHPWGALPPNSVVHVFTNLQTETKLSEDTLTLRFEIYNRPEFASEMLKQSRTKVNFGLSSGTPLKYMMRSIGGWRWQPADSPLTEMEKELIGDSVKVCLRELDKEVGRVAYQKAGYLNPNIFSYDFHSSSAPGANTALVAEFDKEKTTEYYKPIYDNLPSHVQDTIKTETSASGDTWDDLSIDEQMRYVQSFLNMWVIEPITPGNVPDYLNNTLHYDEAEATREIEFRMKRDWNTVLGQRLADKIKVADPCREQHCFYFEKQPLPQINRLVFIPSVEGAVIAPGTGNHYVASQTDFRFSVKYSKEELKVTTNRIIEGRPEVLTGHLNAAGEYEYVIRRVTENITLKFGPNDTSNSFVDKAAVWAYDGAIRIRATKEDTVGIYSATGLLVKQKTVSVGETIIPLESGVYMLVFGDGSTHKVIVR